MRRPSGGLADTWLSIKLAPKSGPFEDECARHFLDY